MQTPPEVAYRHFEPSAHVRERVANEVERLDQFHPRITSCQVVVERESSRHNKGNEYRVRIYCALPGGKEVSVNRTPGDVNAHEDVLVAVRDAFHAAQRQLEDAARTLRGDVKAHEAPPEGRIVRFLAEKGAGFLEDSEGREIYFHRNSVVNGDFDELRIGDVVRFHEEIGAEGPQASTVTPVRGRRSS